MVVELGRVDGEADRLDHVDDAAPLRFAQRAGEMRVGRVERKADADRFAVPQAVVGQRFQLVCGPVAVIERPRGALLERIAALRDVREVQRRRPPDDLLHHRQVASLQGRGMPFDEVEEVRIANQRGLDRFRNPAAPVAVMQRRQEAASR